MRLIFELADVGWTCFSLAKRGPRSSTLLLGEIGLLVFEFEYLNSLDNGYERCDAIPIFTACIVKEFLIDILALVI